MMSKAPYVEDFSCIFLNSRGEASVRLALNRHTSLEHFA